LQLFLLLLKQAGKYLLPLNYQSQIYLHDTAIFMQSVIVAVEVLEGYQSHISLLAALLIFLQIEKVAVAYQGTVCALGVVY